MITLTLPIKPHENQIPIMYPTARFNVIAAGRRYGKTESQKLRAIYMALEGNIIWWVNPTFDNTTETWREFLAFFEPIAVKVDRSRREILLANGGSIRMVGANNFKRGSGIQHVFIDEAAFIDLADLWDYQLRPMLLDNEDTGATFLSSTNGRNMFWTLYQRGLDPAEPDWQSWHFTSYDNPLLDPHEIEDIKRNTPERVFLQEYLAEFLEDGGAVFRNILACRYKEGQAIPTETRNPTVIGVDWARYRDYTVFYLMDTATHQVLDYDRFNQIDWTLQRGRLLTMANRWKCKQVIAEANSIGEPNIEELRKEGLQVTAFTTTAASKQQIINRLALTFEQNDITIPNDPVLIAELQAYTIDRLPGGNYRYSAPPGLHDDCVMALALAWHGVIRGSRTEIIEVPNIFGR
jgi:Terminase large subunit, T4likevirus-type, N-terminal/Terminase RNaseH-like domain